MKKIFKKILQYYLKFWTKIAILIHRPIIIGIAGSVNKSFFRDDIKKMLEKNGESVRAAPKNFNTEIGLPLAILFLPSGYNSYLKWFPAILNAPLAVFKKFPKYLVLEFGTSKSGDMKYLLSIAKPKISVITDITQKYLEAFDDMNDLVAEYAYLIKKTKKDGLIVLNNDNIKLEKLLQNTKQNKKSFAVKNQADCQAIKIERGESGQKLKINFKRKVKDYDIKKFGKHHVYSFMASLIIENYVLKKYE